MAGVMGRPITCGFSKDHVDLEAFREILFRMENGEAVTSICQEPGVPPYSVFSRWCNSSPELFAEYARARQIQADYYADQTVAIADFESDNIRARNRMDARRWHASKIAPRKYGDRIQNEINATIENKYKVDLSSMDGAARDALKKALLEQMRSQSSQPTTIDGEYREVE